MEQVLMLQPVARTCAGAGEKYQEKGAEWNSYILTVTLVHQIQVEELGAKNEDESGGKKGRGEGEHLGLIFVFFCLFISKPILIANKLN